MNTENFNDIRDEHFKAQRKSRLLIGLLFIGGGLLIMLKKSGVDIPGWIFSWQLLLIAIGLVIGIKHNFRFGGWIIPILIGSFFLIDEFYPLGSLRSYLFPTAIVIIGLVIIFKPRRGWKNTARHKNHSADKTGAPADEDILSATAIFGSVEKNVFSKNFKGGEVTSVFGGAEINLTHADITGTVILDTTQIFGGAKIIVPRHWQVKPEVTAIFGGVEDKRMVTENPDPDKILVVKGIALFGGLEINSY